jgi:hypothetical protein
MWRGSSRKWWVALAIVAFAFLSLRPACELWLSHTAKHDASLHASTLSAVAHGVSHPAHDDFCCASVQTGALVKFPDVVSWRTVQGELPAISVYAGTVFRAVTPLLRVLTISVNPPGNHSFYERSARILR